MRASFSDVDCHFPSPLFATGTCCQVTEKQGQFWDIVADRILTDNLTSEMDKFVLKPPFIALVPSIFTT